LITLWLLVVVVAQEPVAVAGVVVALVVFLQAQSHLTPCFHIQ
jgi:hypothetical protein